MSDAPKVGMPSAGGMKDALVDYGLGVGGGIVYAISRALTGSGLIGGLVGAALAGSMIKGTRGTVISTILGFQTIVGSFGAAPAQAAPASADTGVM